MFASRAKVAWGGSLWSTAWFIPSGVLLGSPMEHWMAMVHSSDVSQWFSKKEERRIGVGVWLTGGRKWMELGIQFIFPYEPNSHFPWCQNKNQAGCTDNLSISDLSFLPLYLFKFWVISFLYPRLYVFPFDHFKYIMTFSSGLHIFCRKMNW